MRDNRCVFLDADSAGYKVKGKILGSGLEGPVIGSD
jgi:hypothetical protein